MSRKQPGRKRKAGIKPETEIAVIDEFIRQHASYGETTVVDLSGELLGGKKGMVRVLRNLYPNIVDRWLAEGGPGFEEPQRRAVEHVRSLWHRAGTEQRLCANYTGMSYGAGVGEGQTQQEALTELARYSRDLPRPYWETFENVVRWDEPAGVAGSRFAQNTAQQQAHAKACVGFCASMIAMWRGF